MCGIAVSDDHEGGLYLVTQNKKEVRSYRNAAKSMLRSARPLMNIYRSDRQEKFAKHLRTLWKEGDRRMIFSGLPLFTISEELLQTP